MAKPKTIIARATVNLSGFRAGETAEVNPDEPRTAALLKSGLLVNADPYATVEEDEPKSAPALGRARQGKDVPADGSEHELIADETESVEPVEAATKPYEPPPAA